MSSQDVKLEIAELTSALNNKYDRTDFLYSDITNIDLDNITIPGNYISHSYSKSLHYPYFISDDVVEENCILKVNTDTSNDLIIQELEIGKYSNFRRIHKDSGWQGWIQTSGININEVRIISTDEPGIIFYVSKSGDDNNDGFSWDTSLLTIEEAIRRTKLTDPYYDNGNHEIRIGAGDWGFLNINHTNNLLTLTGYTNDITKEFPKFSKIAFKDSTNGLLQNLQVDIIDSAYSSNIRLSNKNKLHMVQARFNSTITVLTGSYIQIVSPIIESSKAYFFNIYANSSLYLDDGITFDIPIPINFTTSFIRAYYNANIYWNSISTHTWITPENLTVNGTIYARYNSMFNSNTDWNTSDITQYFPFNYTTVKSIVDTSSFCGARNIDVIRFGGDNNAWYKKYSNGWIEQGGVSGALASNTRTPITFNIPFTTTSYSIYAQAINASADLNGNVLPTCYTVKTNNTTFTLHAGSFNSNAGNITYNWYACGY